MWVIDTWTTFVDCNENPVLKRDKFFHLWNFITRPLTLIDTSQSFWLTFLLLSSILYISICIYYLTYIRTSGCLNHHKSGVFTVNTKVVDTEMVQVNTSSNCSIWNRWVFYFNSVIVKWLLFNHNFTFWKYSIMTKYMPRRNMNALNVAKALQRQPF